VDQRVAVSPASTGNNRDSTAATTSSLSMQSSTTITPIGKSWGGVNSFFLHTLSHDQQTSIIEQLRLANIKTIRIFILQVGANSKGTGSSAANDIEDPVGTYNDAQLKMVDDLMVKTFAAGIKLVIALHDRYSLGCWSSDAYVSKYSLQQVDCASNVGQQNLYSFYSGRDSGADFDLRVAHILNYRSAAFNNQRFGKLSQAIHSFDLQNEGQGHLSQKYNAWWCERATAAKALIASDGSRVLDGPRISTGGGANFEDSSIMENYQCAAIDIIAIHTYSGSDEELRSALTRNVALAQQYNKAIVLQVI
jgi:mannan endo-1,4-beta-mannosidase